MKKITCLLLALSFLFCNACYPTGNEKMDSLKNENTDITAENIDDNSGIDLEELNKTEIQNLTYDFKEPPEEYEKSYPCLTAEFVDVEKYDKKTLELLLDNNNITDYIVDENLMGTWNNEVNTDTVYYFDVYNKLPEDINDIPEGELGALNIDTGYISFSRSFKIKPYSFSLSKISAFKTPENLRMYYADEKTDVVDLEYALKDSGNILNELGIENIKSEPEVYVINNKAVNSVPGVIKNQFPDFEREDEAYLIQYRMCAEGLSLIAFTTESNAKGLYGIDTWATFIYSKNGIEDFKVNPIEIVKKSEKMDICSYETAVLAVKKYAESSLYYRERVNISGGELNYITEFDPQKTIVNLRPVWVFVKKSMKDDDEFNLPYYHGIIVDALTGEIYY